MESHRDRATHEAQRLSAPGDNPGEQTRINHRVEALRQAVANYSAGRGEPLIDEGREELKAPVKRRALLLLDQRARSREELRRRLGRLDFDVPPEIIDEVVDDLARSGLLNDEEFACEWVRQRVERRGKSRAVLERELKDKGVGEQARRRALAQIDQDSETETARAVAVKKARSISSIPEDRRAYEKALRRVVGVLARRGFSQSVAVPIAREAIEERIAELGGDPSRW